MPLDTTVPVYDQSQNRIGNIGLSRARALTEGDMISLNRESLIVHKIEEDEGEPTKIIVRN